MYICIHTFTYMLICVHIFFEQNVFVNIHVYMYFHVYIYTHIYMYNHTHTHTPTYTHTHTHTHAHTHTHMHKHTHTHKNTYINRPVPSNTQTRTITDMYTCTYISVNLYNAHANISDSFSVLKICVILGVPASCNTTVQEYAHGSCIANLQCEFSCSTVSNSQYILYIVFRCVSINTHATQ